jgi:hypothetical protein
MRGDFDLVKLLDCLCTKGKSQFGFYVNLSRYDELRLWIIAAASS